MKITSIEGATPIIPAADLKSMGVKVAVYASLLLRTSVKAIQASLRHLRAAGDTSAILDSMITIEERARVTRKDVLDALEKRFTAELKPGTTASTRSRSD